VQGQDEAAASRITAKNGFNKYSAHAFAFLTKGSEHRQIAATRFNDHSSRSHSVFTITVHLKEKNNNGDNLLKVGKLNLVQVDLVRSENWSLRSGKQGEGSWND
jgi:kinesin family protein 11